MEKDSEIKRKREKALIAFSLDIKILNLDFKILEFDLKILNLDLEI